jgi:hypothetical protein
LDACGESLGFWLVPQVCGEGGRNNLAQGFCHIIIAGCADVFHNGAAG